MRVFESAGGAEKSKTLRAKPEEARHSPLPVFSYIVLQLCRADSTHPSAVLVQFSAVFLKKLHCKNACEIRRFHRLVQLVQFFWSYFEFFVVFASSVFSLPFNPIYDRILLLLG